MVDGQESASAARRDISDSDGCLFDAAIFCATALTMLLFFKDAERPAIADIAGRHIMLSLLLFGLSFIFYAFTSVYDELIRGGMSELSLFETSRSNYLCGGRRAYGLRVKMPYARSRFDGAVVAPLYIASTFSRRMSCMSLIYAPV